MKTRTSRSAEPRSRPTPPVDYWWGRTFLGILYVAVGTARLIADVVFWRAVFGRAGRAAVVAAEDDESAA